MKINRNMLEKAEVISFDIFDTLVKRNVPNPNEIFNTLLKKKPDYLDLQKNE